MGWMGKKRKEVSQGGSEQVAALHEVSPPPSLAPALSSSTSSGSSMMVQELLPVHRQLRAVSIRKLAVLQAPSPHPLAEIFNQQIPFAPGRRARSFPASTNPPHTASDASERVKLLLNLMLENASQARPIQDDLRFTRSSTPRIRPRSPADISTFLNRPAFEERTVVYYHDHVSIVTPAHPEKAVASIEFSPHLLSLADATGGYFATPTPAPPSGPIDEIEAEQAERVSEATQLDVAAVGHVGAAGAVETKALASEVDAAVRQSPEKKAFHVDFPKCTSPTLPTSAAKPTAVRPGPSFRSSFVPKTIAPTWDDSSEEESDQVESSDEDEPLAIVAKRHSLAFPPNKVTPVKEPIYVPVDAERVAKEERREAERRRRYREEVEKTRARRESSRRGDVERKIGIDAASRPSALCSQYQSQSQPRPRPASAPRTSTEPTRISMPASTTRISLPAARTRTSSYSYQAPPLASRRSQSFYEMPKAYPLLNYPLAPPRAMSMVYPAYGPMPMAMSMSGYLPAQALTPSHSNRRHSHPPHPLNPFHSRMIYDTRPL